MCQRLARQLAPPLLMLALLPIAAVAQTYTTSPLETWGVNGTILDIERVGDRLFVAGAFTRAAPTRGGLVMISGITGELRPTFNPRIPSGVTAIAPDGRGGWYVGGSRFGPPGPVPGAQLLRVGSHGIIDPAFAPVVEGFIKTIAVVGDRVFIGGELRNVGGQTPGFIAALDSQTGALLNWRSPAIAGTLIPNVRQLHALGGGRLLVLGDFTTVGTAARPGLAILDSSTGALLPWAPSLRDTFTGAVRASDVAVSGNQAFLCGPFTSVNGEARQWFAQVDLTTGDLLPWTPHGLPTGREVFSCAMGLADDRVYSVVYYAGAGGLQAPIALNRATGDLIPQWQPAVPIGLWWETLQLIPANGRVYVKAVHGNAREESGSWLWAVDTSTGTRDSTFAPQPDEAVNAVVVDGTDLMIAGVFVGVGSVPQGGIMALDLATLTRVDWNPGFRFADSLAVAGGRLFINASGATSSGVVAFDLATLERAAWEAADTSLSVRTIEAVAGKLVVGRSTMHDPRLPPPASKEIVMILDPITGARTTPPVLADTSQTYISTMVGRGTTAYVSGWFPQLNGSPRSSVAAIDVRTGTVLPWAPNGAARLLTAGAEFIVINAAQLFATVPPSPVAVHPESGAVLARTNVPAGQQWQVDAVAGTRAAITASGLQGSPPQEPTRFLIDYATGVQHWVVRGPVDTFAVPTPPLRVWDDYIVASGGTRLGAQPTGGLLIFPAIRPHPPQQVQASVSNRLVTLSWQLATSSTIVPDTILIEAGGASGLTDLGVFPVSAAMRTISVQVGPGWYFVRLRSRAGSDISAPSNEVSFTVGAVPGSPGTLSQVVMGSGPGAYAQLSWSAPAIGALAGYIVEVGSASGLADLARVPVGTSPTSLRIARPPSGVYFVRIRAIGAEGAGPPSNEVRVVVP